MIFECFWSFSTMRMHAQACVCWSKYTTFSFCEIIIYILLWIFFRLSLLSASSTWFSKIQVWIKICCFAFKLIVFLNWHENFKFWAKRYLKIDGLPLKVKYSGKKVLTGNTMGSEYQTSEIQKHPKIGLFSVKFVNAHTIEKGLKVWFLVQ